MISKIQGQGTSQRSGTGGIRNRGPTGYNTGTRRVWSWVTGTDDHSAMILSLAVPLGDQRLINVP